MTTTPAAPTFSSDSIVDGHDLYFDAGDKRNGSLYLCVPRGAARPDAALAALRSAALWSDEPDKKVADEQRQAYKDGLQFVAAVEYGAADERLVLARFDHPRFPSDASRFQAWLHLFDGSHQRAR